jgi:5-methylcytosine-specific restriction protein A
MAKTQTLTGKYLNRLWGVNAKHALYREDGKWYHHLQDFPGALFDACGYVRFETEKDYTESSFLQIGQDLHVPCGISTMPQYVRITEKPSLQSISLTIKNVSDGQKSYKTKRTTLFHTDKVPEGQFVAKRNLIQNERIIRDTKVSAWVKFCHEYKCQLCGATLVIRDNQLYAEAHHIKPLGNNHNGPDVVENILCVCPNHHVLLDLGAIQIDKAQLHDVKGHDINPEYIAYHNSVIYKK